MKALEYILSESAKSYMQNSSYRHDRYTHQWAVWVWETNIQTIKTVMKSFVSRRAYPRGSDAVGHVFAY